MISSYKLLITQKFRFKEVLLPFLLVHSSYFSSERKQRNNANSFYILQTSRLPNEEINSETRYMLIRPLFQRLKFSESKIKKPQKKKKNPKNGDCRLSRYDRVILHNANDCQTPNDSEGQWLGLGNWVNQVPLTVIKLAKLTWNLIHSVS